MASADGTSPSSDRRGGLRRLLPLRKDFISPKPAADRSPLIVPSPPSPPSTAPPPPGGKKKGFAAAAFRGLGCTSASSSQAVAPAVAPAAAAVVRSSADWQGKRPRRRRAKQKKERRGQAGGGDVWCTPGIPFAADASVDCVVSHHQMIGRGRVNGERIHREVSLFLSWNPLNSFKFPFLNPLIVVRGEGWPRLTAIVAEAKEADDVVVAEAEEDVELQAEGAVETLAGAKDLEGDEGGGSGGEFLGMAATASQRGKNQREEAAACSSTSEDETRPMASRERSKRRKRAGGGDAS